MNAVRWILTLTAATCVTTPGWSETITVRDEAYVKGPRITLGDVAKIDGPMAAALADIELTNAAAPGAARRINAALIESRIRNAGVEVPELAVAGAPSVNATTLHLEASSEMLAEDLRRFIEAAMPWDPRDAVIEVTVPPQGAMLPDGALEIRWEPAPQYRYVGVGAFSGNLLVDGTVKKTVTCTANVTAYTDVLVAVDDIGRGELLSLTDVAVERRPVASLRYGALAAVEEIEGQVARSTILPGQVITKREVVPQQIVKKNQMVTVEVQTGGLTVQTRARALSNAGAGEVVTCENLGSKGQFTGVVREDGVVIAP